MDRKTIFLVFGRFRMGLFGKNKSDDRDFDTLLSVKSEDNVRGDIETRVDPILPDIDD